MRLAREQKYSVSVLSFFRDRYTQRIVGAKLHPIYVLERPGCYSEVSHAHTFPISIILDLTVSRSLTIDFLL